MSMTAFLNITSELIIIHVANNVSRYQYIITYRALPTPGLRLNIYAYFYILTFMSCWWKVKTQQE